MVGLTFWSIFAAIMFCVSLIAHGSTFFGIDPMEVFPGVMWIHLLIFPPCIAAIFYAKNADGSKAKRQGIDVGYAPLRLKIIAGGCVAYALVLCQT